MNLRFFPYLAAVFCLSSIVYIPCFADSSSPAIEVVEAPAAAIVSEVETVKESQGKAKVEPSLPKTKAAQPDSFAATSSRTKVTPGMALQTAKGEKLAVAMGHYARSRALLISALREFDKGYALVDPSALLDSDGWRQGVTMRAQELARVLDPQPRESKGGIRFDSSTAGIGDAGALNKK